MSQFEQLLNSVSTQLGGVERLLANTLEQAKENHQAIGDLRERVRALETEQEHDGEAIRNHDGKSETRDQTINSIRTQIRLLEDHEKQFWRELDQARKALARHSQTLSNRAWVKVFWGAAIPAIVTIITALIMKKIGG